MTYASLTVKINLYWKTLSLQVSPGEIAGLVAPNGTGKTTLLKSIVGLTKIRRGSCRVNGMTIIENRENFLSSVFFIENTNSLYDEFAVFDLLKMVKEIWKSGVPLSKVTKLFDIERYYPMKFKNLSLGMKQHVLISMYVLSDCKLLLLDEPLNGLDPTSIFILNELFSRLRSEGKTVLLSSHNLTNISEICSKVLFLKNRKIESIVDAGKDLEEYYKELYVESRGD